jgi:hypothetical protein
VGRSGEQYAAAARKRKRNRNRNGALSALRSVFRSPLCFPLSALFLSLFLFTEKIA